MTPSNTLQILKDLDPVYKEFNEFLDEIFYKAQSEIIAKFEQIEDFRYCDSSLLSYYLYEFGLIDSEIFSESVRRQLLQNAFLLNTQRYTCRGINLLFSIILPNTLVEVILPRMTRTFNFSRYNPICFKKNDGTINTWYDNIPRFRRPANSVLNKTIGYSNVITINIFLDQLISQRQKEFLEYISRIETCDIFPYPIFENKFFIKVNRPVYFKLPNSTNNSYPFPIISSHFAETGLGNSYNFTNEFSDYPFIGLPLGGCSPETIKIEILDNDNLMCIGYYDSIKNTYYPVVDPNQNPVLNESGDLEYIVNRRFTSFDKNYNLSHYYVPITNFFLDSLWYLGNPYVFLGDPNRFLAKPA